MGDADQTIVTGFGAAIAGVPAVTPDPFNAMRLRVPSDAIHLLRIPTPPITMGDRCSGCMERCT